MDLLSHKRIIGIDVSRDWLDIYCLADGARKRFTNSDAGHERLVKLAQDRNALVCFEATGGQEWGLWVVLDGAGIPSRQLPPAQIKAFAASCGTRAKTDRIDAKLIARFMAFRPDAGRRLPHQKLRVIRALVTKRRQLVEARKRLLLQIKAQNKHSVTDIFELMDDELKAFLDQKITNLEAQIEQAVASDHTLTETMQVLRSIPGIGPVASTMLIAEMPELGQISGAQAAALTGLAPIPRDSGTMRGKRSIGGGRYALRHVLFQAAIVAKNHNPDMRIFAERLKTAGKPHKVIITAIARKLITIANALCKTRQIWKTQIN